eukprot:10718753-Alexandrium_andersonii.AAC.1
MMVMVACHCRNQNMVMTMVVVVVPPSLRWARIFSSELQRGPFCATRTSPELVWDSFWTAFQAERRGGDDHDATSTEELGRQKRATLS